MTGHSSLLEDAFRALRNHVNAAGVSRGHVILPRLSQAQSQALLDREEELKKTLNRAAFIAEHLMQMIDRETWRATGGDDGQGHYEGDYHEAQTFEEIQAWKQIAG